MPTPISGAVESSRPDTNIVLTAKGSSIIMVGKLFTYVCRFVIAYIMARVLGAERYGLYNLAMSASMIAGGIALFGLDTTVTRNIAILNSRKDKPGVWGAIQVGLGLSFLTSILISVALFALAYPIAESIFHEPRLAPLLQITSLFVPFLVMSDVLAGATRGFKNMRDTVIAQSFVQPTIRLILILILAATQLNLTRAIIVFGVSDLAASIILLYFLNKRFSLKRSMTSARRDTRQMLGFTLPLWLSDIVTTFRGQIQILLIGSLDSVKGVGIFAIANQVNLIGNLFHASIGQSARPLIAELHDQGKRIQLEHLYQTSTRWVIMLNLPFTLIMLLFPREVMSLFGKSFAEGAPALAIMALVNLLHVSTGMCGAILDMTGHTGLKLFNSVVRVSLAILANFLLIPRFGITGAALAALIHEFVANLLPLVQVWFLYRLLPYNRSIFKPVLAGLAAAGLALAARYGLPGDESPIMNLLLVFLVLAVYAAAIQLLGLSLEEKTMIAHFRRRVDLLFSRSQLSRLKR